MNLRVVTKGIRTVVLLATWLVAGAVTVMAAAAPAHRQSNHPYNHYSVLGTIQRLWNLPCLANTCKISDADLMFDLFDNRFDN